MFDGESRSDNVEDENRPLLQQEGSLRFFGGYTGHYDDQPGNSQSSRQEVQAVVDVVVGGEEKESYQNTETHSVVYGSANGDDEGNDSTFPPRAGPTVTCRICEAEIPLEGRTTQHVVRCQRCSEVTPIRAAPPGKKYVRCPCNCLLVCKASSNRIACPRPNCRRVITLVASAPMGTAVRAPAGTCRVQCCHCAEMFMFNTLANTVANCPHCKKSSSVGANYARSRALIYLVSFIVAFLVTLGVVLGTAHNGSLPIYAIWIFLGLAVVVCLHRFVYFARLKVSQVLGPI